MDKGVDLYTPLTRLSNSIDANAVDADGPISMPGCACAIRRPDGTTNVGVCRRAGEIAANLAVMFRQRIPIVHNPRIRYVLQRQRPSRAERLASVSKHQNTFWWQNGQMKMGIVKDHYYIIICIIYSYFSEMCLRIQYANCGSNFSS